MVKPHFFGICSTLGLVTKPHRMELDNSGVRFAPQAVLTEAWLNRFPFAPLNFITTELPDNHRYPDQLLEEYRAVAEQIAAARAADEAQVVVGGDHSVTFASLLALSQSLSLENVAYIQLDAHADCNTFVSSPTGNFHGIYVRSLLGESGNEGIDTAAKTKLLPENLWFIGNLDLDPAELDFFSTRQIKKTSVADLSEKREKVLAELITWFTQFEHLHISCDLDGFDQQFAPATGIPCTAGLDPAVVLPVLKQLVRAARVVGLPISLDVVELNPCLPGAAVTTELAQKIIETVLRE